MNNYGFGKIVVRRRCGSILLKQTLFKITTILAFLLLLFVSGVKAQNTADVLGVVTDSSGSAVPNAKVTITNVGTNISRSVITGSDGNYVFALLPVGTYSVSVEVTGFKTYQASNITLAAGDHVRVDAKMEVGAVTESVVVEASDTPLLQTATATVSSVITPTATQDLPLNGRNFITLVQLAPGASGGGGSQSSTRPDDRRLSSAVTINSGSGPNNFLLDGMDNNERAIGTIIVKPAIDALEEIKVETNTYSASLGRVGGGVITMITKSGTNSYHGDAFEFLRNDAFDAKNYFNIKAKPPLRQNIFGGSLGGPIIKNKAFFFGDYEGFRVINGQTFNSTLPTPCELGRVACNGVTALGNFSDISAKIYDPTTGMQYQSGGVMNVIPAGSISPIGAHYAALEPTVTGCTVSPCQYISNGNLTQNFDNADGRFDYTFSDTNSLFVRYTLNHGTSVIPSALPGVSGIGNANYTVFGNNPDAAGFPGTNKARQENVTLGWTEILRPTLILNLRGSFARYVSISNSNNQGHNVNTDFGGPNINFNNIPGTDGLAFFSFTNGGYGSLGDQTNLPTDYWDTNYQYAGDLSWTRGAHSMKFGGSLLRRDWETLQQSRRGSFQFSNVETDGAIWTCPPPPQVCSYVGGNKSNGNSIASMLIGYPNFDQQILSINKPSNRMWEIGEYAQDDWKVSRRITINLGLRYDIFTPFVEKHDTISNFDPTNLAVLESGRVQVAGQFGVPRNTGIQTERNMLQPRLGFAALIGHNFVLRAGFGTAYAVSNTSSQATLRNAPFGYSNILTNGQPFTTLLPIPTTNPSTECLVAACGFVSTSANPSNSISRGEVTNFRNAMVYTYNVTLEKSFGANAVTVMYVGQPGRQLNRIIGNADQPGAPGLTGCLNVKEPGPCQPFAAQLPLTSAIQLNASDASSSYNAVSAVFERRAGKGLTVQANYTYAAALSDTSPDFQQEPFNVRSLWGFSGTDVRHRVAATVDYQLPFGKSLNGFEGGVIKGWEVNAVYTFQSGAPFTAGDSLDQSGVVQASGNPDRPNMVAARYVSHTPILVNGVPVIPWFDPTDFVLQPAGFDGNEHINQLFGPAPKDFDFSLFKDFPIRENLRVQFRAEVFNLTNTPSFGNPKSTINAYANNNGVGQPATNKSNFSYSTSTNGFYTPRQIQFAVKLLF